MSTLTYNGVRLPYVMVQPTFEPQYSDDGADYLDTRVSITVTSTITSQIPGLVLPGESWASALRRLRHLLEVPRKSLTLRQDDEVIVDATGPDVRNGPFPEVLSFTELIGTQAAVVQFQVVTHLRQCAGQSEPPKYLSNRWDESVSIGEDFTSQRKRRGKLVIRGDMQLNADAFRHIVTPTIPRGFARVSSSYEVASDGLSLQYQFVDEERWALPPAPAVKADGSFVVSVTNNGAKSYGDVTIQLTGDVKTSKQALIATAVSLAMERLGRARPKKTTGGGWLLTGSVSEDLFANRIKLSIRAPLEPSKRAIGAPAGSSNKLGKAIVGGVLGGLNGLTSLFSLANLKPGDPPPKEKDGNPVALVPGPFGLMGFGPKPLYSDPDLGATSPNPGLRSTAGLFLVAAALNDPCLAATVAASAGVNPTSSQSGTPESTSILPQSTVNVVPILPATDDLEPSPISSLYNEYHVRIRYIDDPHVAACPEQKSSAASGITRFVKLAADQLKLKVEWTAERVGDPPEVPRRGQDGVKGDNYVWLGGEFEPPVPELTADNVTMTFRASGVYWYGVRDPSKVEFTSPIPPWIAELCGKAPKPAILDGPKLAEFEGDKPSMVPEASADGEGGGPGSEYWRKRFANWREKEG